MRVVFPVVVGTLLFFPLARSARAEIVTPSSVTATSQFGLGIFIDNLIDGSGLDGNGPIADQLHDNVGNNMWFSGCGDAGIDGGTPETGCDDPFAVGPVDEQIVEFELDSTYELDSALIWQYNELNPAGPFAGRGTKRFEMLVSPTLTDPFTSMGVFDLDIAEPGAEVGAFTAPAQTIPIAESPVARRVRFHILEAHSGNPNEYVGFSEVRFDGTILLGSLDPRVTRSFSSSVFTNSSTPIGVTLEIVLDDGTGPFDFEIAEEIPANWTATDVSAGGSFSNGTVSWSLAAVDANTNLSYVLVPDDNTLVDVTIGGTYSFDGGGAKTTLGERVLIWAETTPGIATQPVGGRAPVGGAFTFTVEASGAEPLSYQWTKDGSDLGGATESSLALSDLQLADSGVYTVVVQNEFGMVESDGAILEVTPPNLALCGVASQSTTFFDAPADKAIDGDTSGTTDAVTHTLLDDPQPWWEVRLAADAQIDTIVLWNRSELADRLSNFTVFVLDADREEVWSDEFFPAGAVPAFPDTSEQGFAIEVGETGRIVRIEKGEDVTASQSGRILSLAEVEVFGAKECVVIPEPACPSKGQDEFGDTHCTNLVVDGPDDFGPGQYLATATGGDDTGDFVLYTFTAVHQTHGTTVLRGPQDVNWAFLPLTYGDWEVSVTVDDFANCADAAENATCTEPVQVIDPDCEEGELCNVAIRGVASQSSVFIYEARLAIDGNTDGNLDNASVTHTGFDDPAPTWEVELDQDYSIETIVLWNRTDCCSERLTNFTVTVFDANRTQVRQEALFTDGKGFPDTTIDGFAIPMEETVGRIVQVQLRDTHPGFNPGDFFLSLAEVQILGEPADVGAKYIRGDTNADGGKNIADPVYLLNNLFGGGPPCPCAEACDINDDGGINIADPVYELNNLFGGGPPVPPPGSCDEAPVTEDVFPCDSFPPCA